MWHELKSIIVRHSRKGLAGDFLGGLALVVILYIALVVTP